ncbi:tetratricopeptide repeat protein [Microtetraspora niveoalba]|uniref:tetratricopeptide repeat protein n=1 Tax=Microtetraspora niveoalba TaxID=46175 RepID=UPI0008301452|nr:tetratricopeptide repeat protein [Microtetraspora niveoalba]
MLGRTPTDRYKHSRFLGADALTLYGKALHAARRLNDPVGEGRALTDLGWVHQARGDHGPAGEHFEQALAACRAAGDRRGEARAREGLADLAHHI